MGIFSCSSSCSPRQFGLKVTWSARTWSPKLSRSHWAFAPTPPRAPSSHCCYMKACTGPRNCMKAPPETVELPKPYGISIREAHINCVDRHPSLCMSRHNLNGLHPTCVSPGLNSQLLLTDSSTASFASTFLNKSAVSEATKVLGSTRYAHRKLAPSRNC